jgi:aminoglycoside/choline kinase family phosphotransferase
MDLRGFVKSYMDETYPISKGIAWQRLPSDGSKRAFYRLSAEHGSFIVMEYPPSKSAAEKENFSYLRIGEHLLGKGIPVARIFSYDLQHGWFIMEDLGKHNLQEIALSSGNRIDIYKRVLELLVKLQIDGREDFKAQWCAHTKYYDRFVMEKHESEYFLTSFVQGFLGMEKDLSALSRSFSHLSHMASLADNDFFLHRDFQSRNLIVHGEKIGIVDWQGGRLGPLQYDLASLLIDPYVGLTSDERILLYDYYLTLVERRLPGISESFSRRYHYIAIQRNLQILGAFSYLGNVQGKKWFLDYIPPALQSLVRLLEGCEDPELHQLKTLSEEINARRIEPHGHRRTKKHQQGEHNNGK